MKMETVRDELQKWGELMITTAAGETYEIHIGDTEFDLSGRCIRLTSSDAQYIIEGDSVESIKMHYGHPVGGPS